MLRRFSSAVSAVSPNRPGCARARHPAVPFLYVCESVFLVYCRVIAGGSGIGMNLSDAASGAATSPSRIILVGVRGFGQVHAERIARLSDQGLVELVAAVDPGVVLDPPIVYGVDLYADLSEALAAVGPVDVDV